MVPGIQSSDHPIRDDLAGIEDDQIEAEPEDNQVVPVFEAEPEAQPEAEPPVEPHVEPHVQPPVEILVQPPVEIIVQPPVELYLEPNRQWELPESPESQEQKPFLDQAEGGNCNRQREEDDNLQKLIDFLSPRKKARTQHTLEPPLQSSEGVGPPVISPGLSTSYSQMKFEETGATSSLPSGSQQSKDNVEKNIYSDGREDLDQCLERMEEEDSYKVHDQTFDNIFSRPWGSDRIYKDDTDLIADYEDQIDVSSVETSSSTRDYDEATKSVDNSPEANVSPHDQDDIESRITEPTASMGMSTYMSEKPKTLTLHNWLLDQNVQNSLNDPMRLPDNTMKQFKIPFPPTPPSSKRTSPATVKQGQFAPISQPGTSKMSQSDPKTHTKHTNISDVAPRSIPPEESYARRVETTVEDQARIWDCIQQRVKKKDNPLVAAQKLVDKLVDEEFKNDPKTRTPSPQDSATKSSFSPPIKMIGKGKSKRGKRVKNLQFSNTYKIETGVQPFVASKSPTRFSSFDEMEEWELHDKEATLESEAESVVTLHKPAQDYSSHLPFPPPILPIVLEEHIEVRKMVIDPKNVDDYKICPLTEQTRADGSFEDFVQFVFLCKHCSVSYETIADFDKHPCMVKLAALLCSRPGVW